jgi:hypothetical protein
MSFFSWVGRPVKELIAMGYPESVAKRISSGELPMDEASRAARRDAFGLDAYHLTNKDFDAFKLGGYDPEMSGEAVWLSPVKQENYPAAHNVFLPLDDPSKYSEILEKQAVTKMGGGRSGAIDARVMPLKVKMDDPLSVDEFNLSEMQDRWAGGSREFPYLINPETSKKLRESGFDSVSNEIGMWDDNYNIGDAEIISLDPTKIRSIFAAFDPEYTGSNILGSRVAPTVGAGILGAYALSRSNNALADPVSDLRTSEAQWDMTPEERAIDDLRASEREFVPESNPQWKSVPLEGLATALGELKGNKNYQNFENVAPFGTGLIDYGYNVATGAEQGLLDYLMAGGEVASLPAPIKKAAKGLIGMLK